MRGLINEDVIVAKIELKCDIKRDPVYDHVYKLDFVVDRFKNIDKLVQVGVQVTTKPNDVAKQREFLSERKKKTLVDRSLYIEILPSVDVSKWGSELIYNAIVSFAFMKGLREKDVIGVRINPDVTFVFFDLEKSIKQYQGRETIKGRIVKYFPDKEYGFISANGKGEWFFHKNNVTDSTLIEKFLNQVVSIGEDGLIKPIFIEFENGGFREGEKIPEALSIKLSKL